MSTKRIGTILALLGVLATAIVIAGCGSSDDDTSTSGGEAQTKESGKLIVGSDIPYPPFEQGRAPDYTGFDIDLVNDLAKRLKLDVQYEDTSFDTIFRDLAAGKFDLVASATTITPEREKTVSFSDPYYFTDQSLTATTDGDVKSTDDLAGKTVGAQKGTTGADYAENETDAKTVRTYAEIDDAFNALVAGQVDAVINDFPSSEDAVKAKKDIEVVQQLVTREEYGLAVQKDNSSLLDSVNSALGEIKDDGTFTKIYEKWFKEKPPSELTS